MRAFPLTVIFGALGLAAALGQQREEEATLIAWEEILHEASKLEAELGLGLAMPAEREGMVRALVERGDRLLEAYAGSRDSEARVSVGGARAAVMSAVAGAVDALREGKVRLAADRVPEGVAVDPWAGVDQEIDFFPEKFGPVRLLDGTELSDGGVGELWQLIPARFRLAEALGLGTNRVVCEPRFIDPVQVNRPGLKSGNGVVVLARLYCEMMGQFVDSAPEAGDGDPSDLPNLPKQAAAEGALGLGGDRVRAAPAVPVEVEETFRVGVISQGRLSAGSNRMNRAFEKRDVYGVEEVSIAKEITHGGRNNPWIGEALPAAAAKRGWLIEPIQSDVVLGESRVEGVLHEKLQSLKRAVLSELRTDAVVRDRLEALRESLRNYLAAVDRDVAADGANGELRVLAESSLRAINLDSLVESGSLDSLDDAVLRRIGPATGLALDAMRRALQVAKVPQEQRAEAEALAGSLNSLARWTLR